MLCSSSTGLWCLTVQYIEKFPFFYSFLIVVLENLLITIYQVSLSKRFNPKYDYNNC